MRLLLDTQIVIWVASDSRRLPKEARRHIDRADAVYISAASLFEIAAKASTGKLAFPMDGAEARLRSANFVPLAVTWSHALRAHDIAVAHRDPFDRLLLAQAVSEPLNLLTADEALKSYSDLVVLV
jgi:PIN domain nuclease of toxin-antitoxin system